MTIAETIAFVLESIFPLEKVSQCALTSRRPSEMQTGRHRLYALE